MSRRGDIMRRIARIDTRSDITGGPKNTLCPSYDGSRTPPTPHARTASNAVHADASSRAPCIPSHSLHLDIARPQTCSPTSFPVPPAEGRRTSSASGDTLDSAKTPARGHKRSGAYRATETQNATSLRSPNGHAIPRSTSARPGLRWGGLYRFRRGSMYLFDPLIV